MEKNKEVLGVKKGAWTNEEDNLLRKCVQTYGEGKWHLVPLRAGLNRCRKSCRLRWLNYLSPNVKRGIFNQDEVDLIVRLHKLLGNRWTFIAGRVPGRTANDIKNFWKTHFEKQSATAAAAIAGGESSAGIKTTTQSCKIFKPIPRTLSKLFQQEPFLPVIQEEEEDEKADECIRWWGNLLEIAEENGQGANSSLFTDEYPPVTDEPTTMFSPGNNYVNQDLFSNLSLDLHDWEL
ncbi:hypothetical protein ABFX02_08G064500 [Erythranthe guttata]